MKTKNIIYALLCPFTEEVHYVGKSTRGLTRPFQHLKQSHSEKINQWVNDLSKINYKPIVKILEYVNDEDFLNLREKYWIQFYLDKGLLLNSNLTTPFTISAKLEEILEEDCENPLLKIAEFLKAQRKKNKLTQEDFASKAGVALTVVRKIEQGKDNISLISLLQVLRMFGATIEIGRIKKL